MQLVVAGFRDKIGIMPTSRRTICRGLSSLDGLRGIGSHLPRSGIGGLDFSTRDVAVRITPMKGVALRVIRGRPYGYVGFTAAASPLPFGL